MFCHCFKASCCLGNSQSGVDEVFQTAGLMKGVEGFLSVVDFKPHLRETQQTWYSVTFAFIIELCTDHIWRSTTILQCPFKPLEELNASTDLVAECWVGSIPDKEDHGFLTTMCSGDMQGSVAHLMCTFDWRIGVKAQTVSVSLTSAPCAMSSAAAATFSWQHNTCNGGIYAWGWILPKWRLCVPCGW